MKYKCDGEYPRCRSHEGSSRTREASVSTDADLILAGLVFPEKRIDEGSWLEFGSNTESRRSALSAATNWCRSPLHEDGCIANVLEAQ